jgi:hypothetical protein
LRWLNDNCWAFYTFLLDTLENSKHRKKWPVNITQIINKHKLSETKAATRSYYSLLKAKFLFCLETKEGDYHGNCWIFFLPLRGSDMANNLMLQKIHTIEIFECFCFKWIGQKSNMRVQKIVGGVDREWRHVNLFPGIWSYVAICSKILIFVILFCDKDQYHTGRHLRPTPKRSLLFKWNCIV